MGHYGCGGIKAALSGDKLGLIDNWLRHIQDIKSKHEGAFKACISHEQQWDLLAELNIIEQTLNVCQTTVVQDAWDRGQDLEVHGWIYSLKDGLLRDLAMSAQARADLNQSYELALSLIKAC